MANETVCDEFKAGDILRDPYGQPWRIVRVLSQVETLHLVPDFPVDGPKTKMINFGDARIWLGERDAA